MERKCTICGGAVAEFEKSDFFEGEGKAGLYFRVSPYMCLSCGHIDFYASDKTIQQYKESIEEQDRLVEHLQLVIDKIEELKNKKKELNDQIAKIQADADNDDITVKQSKEILAKILPIDVEILKIDKELDELNAELKPYMA